MTTNTRYLSLQVNVICVLLALVGSMTIIEHPEWFGRASPAAGPTWDFSVPAE